MTKGMKKCEQWDRNYVAVFLFAKKHGHLKLPSSNSETRRLLTWLGKQKSRAQMPNYQKEKLTALLEAYNVYQQPREEKEREAWDRMYKKLLAHRETHGDFAVSMEDEKSLHTWILAQRQRAREGTLLDERQKKLKSIDFVFQYNAKRKETRFTAKQVQQWDARYDQLAEFTHSHGNCLVPANYDANRPLGNWVSKQRGDFGKGFMDPGRKQRLDQLGFAWTLQGGS
jgi:hypothetical protein